MAHAWHTVTSMSIEPLPGPTCKNFVGYLANGKRVYVRRTKADRSVAPITFAVFATATHGKLTLVGRFHDPSTETRGASRQMYCANGREHGTSACCWTPLAAPISAQEAAHWYAHWWTHVAHARAEVVALTPTHLRRGSGSPVPHNQADRIRPGDLTEEQIRDVRDRVMGGSPLSEDTLVASGDLILDEGDPDVNIADARDRIAAHLSRKKAAPAP